MTAVLAAADVRRARLVRTVRLTVAATITYNVVEAVIALVAGGRASSTALIGFGLDSGVEVASAAAVAWQFSARDPAVREAREQRALRWIALSFLGLALYCGLGSGWALLRGSEADPSVPGIVLAAVSLAVMPTLSFVQRTAGRGLGSASAVADSRQTLLCTWLSAALLVGLALNAALGWWWADPVAGLAVAAVAAREARSAWRGDACCAPAFPRGEEPAAAGCCAPGACACAHG